jgi:integrase
MASFQKAANGYRALVEVKGVRKTKTFPNKRDAKAWADLTEATLRLAKTDKEEGNYTLKQALEKYRDEISIRNAGVRWEQIKINAFLEHLDWLPLNSKISAVTTDHFTKFTSLRLGLVKPATVARELVILSAMMEVARKEWKWIKENPVKDVKKPRKTASRDRLITKSEVKGMLRGLGYKPRQENVRSAMQTVAVTFMLALRTGMRAGDLMGLGWTNIHADHAVVEIDKNGRRSGKGRDVPLSRKALRLVEKMKGWDPISVFGMKSQSLDALFRKIRARQGLEGFTFHDSRHTAATWIVGSYNSKGINSQQAIFDLCKIFGWSDPKRALAYYNPNISDLAARMN